jgi:hypothetical protein|tara:strand:- start:869 stop:1390 length:522 start_codon:yes stop_codon:yes gene_type:complete
MVELVRDRLKTLQLGNVGTELNDASKNAYLNLSEREMKSALAIGDLIQKTRTFNGSTIPNVGGVVTELLVDDTVTTIQPSLGESWNVSSILIQNLDASNASTFTLQLYDGTRALDLLVGAIAAATEKRWGLLSDSTGSFPALNLQLTNSLYLRFSQTGAAPVQVSASYTQDVI